MRPLYEIDGDIYETIERLTDPETGEILHPEILDALRMERRLKIEGVCLAIKNKTAEIEMVEKERLKLQEREKTLERQLEGLKGWVALALGGEKFHSPKVQVSYRQTFRTEILDAKLIPEEYRTVREEVSYDKAAIRKMLMNGGEVPGAELKEGKAVYIK